MGMCGQRNAPVTLPPGKTRYPLYRRLGRPQGQSGQLWIISPPPGFVPQTVQPVASRYTDYAIPAHKKMIVRTQNFGRPDSSSVLPLWPSWDLLSCFSLVAWNFTSCMESETALNVHEFINAVCWLSHVLFLCRLLFGIIIACLVWITPVVIQNGNVPWYYYIVLLATYALHQVTTSVLICHYFCVCVTFSHSLVISITIWEVLWDITLWCHINRYKVKQSLDRPGQALRVPGGWGSQISWQLTHEGGKFVFPRCWPPLLIRIYCWYSFLLEAEVDPTAIEWPEGLCQWKTPMTGK